MKVTEILREKGTNVHTVSPNATLRTAIERMANHGIGALVVLSDNGELVGLLSERDIVVALARSGAAVLADPVADAMTRKIITCSPEDRVNDLMAVMTRSRMRHLTVMDGGRLAGIISIGDLVKARLNELEFESSVLRDAYLRVR
jgi:CBS domain-containing protein